MDETNLEPAADEIAQVLDGYLRERVLPHPILGPFVPDAAVYVSGSVAFGTWDEQSPIDLRLLLPDEAHTRIAAQLREAGLWKPARDFRLRLIDRERFRRYPGTEISILSTSELNRAFRFDLPVSLWVHQHSAMLQDPHDAAAEAMRAFDGQFRAGLDQWRCQHYYYFRQARRDMVPRIMPRRVTTLMAIKRGEAAREALRLAFLADGKPYPYDKWLETMAERETHCGESIVTAVRALIGAREPAAIEHTGKVLRDRVAFALQQGGVTEPWLEQWWLWPAIAPLNE